MAKSLRTAAAMLMTTVCTVALLVLGPAGTASAGVLDVTCTPPSSENATFTPPLTMTPQTVTVVSTVQYGPCVSLSHPAVTSGSSTRTNVVPGRSCLDLLAGGPSTFTITWNTGQTSTISANRTTTIVGAALVVTHTGTVTSGLFTGSTVLQTTTGPATAVLPCTAGLGTVAGIYSLVTLEITSL
ncbi:hypothetical protein B0I31_113175 [Saccharothrix carnea]|uniref:Ig-like domain-containing protein n=1 Tax=Saccharothrix carnea TaxID=1280637 RepID=A0A2P8I217_SACCR|nr:hypothetical protein [Saccharothrix carnea]PSL52502.1 hypothetical protein B0I31_113175 [Saccharothrix carnea]